MDVFLSSRFGRALRYVAIGGATFVLSQATYVADVRAQYIGAQFIDKMQKIGFSTNDGKTEYDDIKNKVMDSLKDYFRPEFLNRLDEIIVFDILNPEHIKQIVSIEVENVKARLLSKEIKLDISDEVLSYLAKEGYNPQYGARPLKRLIQNKILTSVASLMVSEGVMKGGSISVGLNKTNNEFTFDVKKGRRGSILKESMVRDTTVV